MSDAEIEKIKKRVLTKLSKQNSTFRPSTEEFVSKTKKGYHLNFIGARTIRYSI